MLLTVSKRLEFSASRRLWVPDWTESENLAAFGPETRARYGTGRNYVAYFIFSGPVNPANGMLMNISEIKDRAGKILGAGFDHKFLNGDNPAFAQVVPTAENIARQLFLDAAAHFEDPDARLVACHLHESEAQSATCYREGACETNLWFDFSAARRTMSPNLSETENARLFGAAASPYGHGHHYRARITVRNRNDKEFSVSPPFDLVRSCIDSLRSELDHKNLNHEVQDLCDRPITTEVLASYIFSRVSADLPVDRVRLFERPDFFAEYRHDGAYSLGLQTPFSAAHRLHSADLSEAENTELYGKCSNLRGHGHRYVAEATIGGAFDERSGTLANFMELQQATESALTPLRDKHLDCETKEFRSTPSTGENIVRALWNKFDRALRGKLIRLRLWETANNRFTLRRM